MPVQGTLVRFAGVSMVTGTLGKNDPEVGTVIREDDEEYIFVYNGGGSTIPVGQVATVTATTGYTVTVSTTANVDLAVGVCKHTAIPTVNYGWLMTKGFAPMAASAAIAIQPGDMVYPGTNGFFTNIVQTFTTFTSQTVGQSPVVGKCVASAASALTTGAVYVKF